VIAFGLSQRFGPMLDSGFARVLGNRGDAMFIHYGLEHTWQSVSNPHYCGSLFSPPCFFPERHTLWYSEHLLGVAPIYWALRVVLPFDMAYQCWQIVLELLNFAAFALVIRWLRGPHALAILGGYLWAFSLVNIDQSKQPVMIARFAMVLAVYHAWQFVLGLGLTPANCSRHLNRMLAAVFLQGITGLYTGWFLVMGLGTFLLLAVSLQPGGWRNLFAFAWTHSARVKLIVVGWIGALALAYIPYYVVNWGMSRSYSDCIASLPTPEAWLACLPGSVWDSTVGPLREKSPPECWLFCGFGLDALMVLGVVCSLVNLVRRTWRPDSGLMLAALLTAAVWVLLTLNMGPDDFSLWKGVRVIPGATAIRIIGRVHNVVYLFGILGGLMWLARVTESLRPSVRDLVVGLVAIVCIAEQFGYTPPSFKKREFYPIADRTAAELRKGDIGYVIPRYTDSDGVSVTEPVFGEVMGMWCGLRANVPVVNGYGSRVPDATFLGVVFANDAERPQRLREWLQGKFRGKVAIVNPDNLNATEVIVIE
jgi:hypothetical protein